MSGPAIRKQKRDVSGILLLDKPEGISSNAALQRVKRFYQAARAGHTGSLDPIATGLLPICLGHATKLSSFLLDADKAYRVTARMGVKTRTADREGEEVGTSDPTQVTRAQLDAVLTSMLGPQMQVPPMYSALKHQGERLYKLARDGQEVPRAPRPVVIMALKLLSFGVPYFELEVTCSKGTYVRTLVEDVCAAMCQVGHVVELRRIGAAPFWTPDLVTMDCLEEVATRGGDALDSLLLPVVAGAASLPRVEVDEDRAFYLARGQAVRVTSVPDSQAIAVLNAAGRLLGIARRNPEGMLAPSRWLS